MKATIKVSQAATAMVAIFLMAPNATSAFTNGNLVVSGYSGSNPTLTEYTPYGQVAKYLLPAVSVQAEGSAFDTAGNLYLVEFGGGFGYIAKYNSTGELVGDFGSSYGTPVSIAFDSSNNAYVGQIAGTVGQSAPILKFNPAGNLLATFQLSGGEGEAEAPWIALGSDNCTLYYTGVFNLPQAVRRFDVCGGKQLPDFSDSLPGPHSRQMRLLPDGEIIVADEKSLVRFDSKGQVAMTYVAPPGDTALWAMAVSPDGQDIYTGDAATGDIIEYNLSSGQIERQFSTTEHHSGAVTAITVVGEPSDAQGAVGGKTGASSTPPAVAPQSPPPSPPSSVQSASSPCAPVSGSFGKRLLASLKCTAELTKLEAECAYHIAFLVGLPAKVLEAARLASGLYDLSKVKKEFRPILKLYNAILKAKFSKRAPRGFRTGADIIKKFKKARRAYDVIRLLPDIARAVSKADFNEIALDIAEIAKLKSCVQAMVDVLE